jgi:hypothetical protein
MEVVQTDEGDDDGVIWLRCPQCQGFLPKITGEGLGRPAATKETPRDEDGARTSRDGPTAAGRRRDRPDASGEAGAQPAPGRREGKAAEREAAERRAEEKRALAEYAERLAQIDPEAAVPYRPWNSYEVGDLIHHIAWDDCGLVVAKEALPGGRRALKVYFEDRGLVHLIEADPHGS